MKNEVTRYLDYTQSDTMLVEVSFNGAAPEPGSENPKVTEVKSRFISRLGHTPSSPWIEEWNESHGNLTMPSGPWHPFKLTEIIENRIFIALSNEIAEVDPATGKQKWKASTGNTPIQWIMKSPQENSLIVLHGYYGFEPVDGKSNLLSIDLDGREKWRCDPASGDLFANPPYFEGRELKAFRWSSFICTIDHRTGDILKEDFTK